MMLIVGRTKIRFLETLGHGWFGWVVSGTVAGTTKVCQTKMQSFINSLLLMLAKVWPTKLQIISESVLPIEIFCQVVVKILREEAKPEEFDRFTEVKCLNYNRNRIKYFKIIRSTRFGQMLTIRM